MNDNFVFPSEFDKSWSLSNGSFESSFNVLGNGFLTARHATLTSNRQSANDGLFFFLRDEEDGFLWSSALRPTRTIPDNYRVEMRQHSVSFIRRDRGLVTETVNYVPAEGDLAIIRLCFENQGKKKRRLMITSYADVVLLFDNARDIYHPVFSNLAIGSEFLPDTAALRFHRRSPNISNYPDFMARLYVSDNESFLGYESDRKDFIGRGRELARARGAQTAGAGKTGYILDPIAALKTGMTLETGERRYLYLAYAAHFPEDEFDPLKSFPDTRSIEAFFEKEAPLSQPIISVYQPDLAALSPHFSPPQDTITGSLIKKPKKKLLFDNGFGGFDPKTGNYVMDIQGEKVPPRPWINILSNPHFGMLLSESALGSTWSGNSKNNRLSPWSNDPTLDPPAEIIYIKDCKRHSLSSPTPAPFYRASYRVTHAVGSTTYESREDGLERTLKIMVDPEETAKLVSLSLTNESEEERDFSLYYFVDCALEPLSPLATVQQKTLISPEDSAIFVDRAKVTGNSNGNAQEIIYLGCDNGLAAATFDRRQFFGVLGSFTAPKALEQETLVSYSSLIASESCIVIESKLTLAPKEEKEIRFWMGTAPDILKARTIISAFRSQRTEAFLDKVSFSWKEKFDIPKVNVPDVSINLLANTWTPYQLVSSRMWTLGAFYQPGGAYGYRDQLQDCLSLLYFSPSLAREHILRSAQRQFEEGDVQAWWFPEIGLGMRGRVADQALWLPLVAEEYARITGDHSIFEVDLPYLSKDTPLPSFSSPHSSLLSEPLWKHCLRAIDGSLAKGTGSHDLPFIGDGDWNDSFSQVGSQGQGESVWMAFFMGNILQKYIGLARKRKEWGVADRYHRARKHLTQAVEKNAWVGDRYLRAFYDDGTPMGKPGDSECEADAVVSVWAAFSDLGSKARSHQAMETAWRILYDKEHALLHLLYPPFNRGEKNPGYIKDYPPGIRENGGQYNHATLWMAMAFAKLGDRERFALLLEAANPIRRSATHAEALRYATEPYVVAADISTAPDREGEGGWTWYTASAGLMHRTILESLFGLSVTDAGIKFSPLFPPEWPKAELSLTLRGRKYDFKFSAEKTPHTNSISSIEIDGKPHDKKKRIPFGDGKKKQKILIHLS